MSKVNVNRRAIKSDMVKRLDLCIKTCSVNAARKHSKVQLTAFDMNLNYNTYSFIYK